MRTLSIGPYAGPAARMMGNMTYKALDSLSLPVLAFIFLCCGILLHLITEKTFSLPLSTTPVFSSAHRSKLPNHLPIPPWFSFSSEPDTPTIRSSLAKQLENMLYAAHSSQSDVSSSPMARRGSKERARAMSMRCGLGTVVEMTEEEQV